jgi:hypothetical protein
MGREAKILLGFLGLLAGVFCGVLSMKLLVPRPPAGAGPDIHGARMFGGATALVEPPLLVPAFPIRAADFAAAPPLMHEAGPPTADFVEPDRREPAVTETPALFTAASEDLPAELPAETDPVALPPQPPAFAAARDTSPAAADDDLLPPPAEFVLAPPARHIDDVAPPAEGPRDPFVAATGWRPPATSASVDVQPTAMDNAAAALPIRSAGIHVVQPGDSWWSLAEATYGDGRLYRALFAWNRAVDPRITLAAGTELELPPAEKLRAAWPKLIPSAGR